jgi:hypothetical protein
MGVAHRPCSRKALKNVFIAQRSDDDLHHFAPKGLARVATGEAQRNPWCRRNDANRPGGANESAFLAYRTRFLQGCVCPAGAGRLGRDAYHGLRCASPVAIVACPFGAGIGAGDGAEIGVGNGAGNGVGNGVGIWVDNVEAA